MDNRKIEKLLFHTTHTHTYTCDITTFLLSTILAGATLDKNGASATWDTKAKGEETVNADRLHLRQILLGHTAKENEYNVVEVS